MYTKTLMTKIGLPLILFTAISISSCGGGEKSSETTTETTTPEAPVVSDKGVGPVTSIELGEIDEVMVTRGKNVFESKCSACHKFSEKYVGPALAGVTERRKPEWVMNMMLNPEEMLEKDPVAQELLAIHLTKMTFQDITEDQARNILEYFRHVDKGGAE